MSEMGVLREHTHTHTAKMTFPVRVWQQSEWKFDESCCFCCSRCQSNLIKPPLSACNHVSVCTIRGFKTQQGSQEEDRCSSSDTQCSDKTKGVINQSVQSGAVDGPVCCQAHTHTHLLYFSRFTFIKLSFQILLVNILFLLICSERDPLQLMYW